MPGAGSLALAEYLYGAAKKDGSEFGMIGRAVLFNGFLTGGAMDIDPTKFNYLGSPDTTPLNCAVWYKSKIKNLDDAKRSDVTVAAPSTTGPEVLAMNIANRLNWHQVQAHRRLSRRVRGESGHGARRS